MVKLPLFDPLAGVTVHQDDAFEAAVQDRLAVTPTLVVPAVGATFPVAALNVSVGVFPVCVSTYVRVNPLPETVMVADLDVVVVLAV